MTLPPGLLPPRPSEMHKGDAGHVFVIAGSEGLTGAAVLCSMAALRSDAGLVTLGLPCSLNDAMESTLTEVITKPLPETKTRSLSTQALPELIRTIERVDAVVLGPGLSQDPQTQQLVKQLVPKIARPCVLDADGLNALADEPAILKRFVAPAIVTPHPGEMGRLIQLSAAEVQRDRERIAKEFASHYGVIAVLKGHGTIVAHPDGRLWINDTGNPGMATAGMGDVLAGMIGALLGQKLPAFDAARLGAHLHGLAGDLAASEQGSVGLIASDLLARIPLAIRRYQERQAS